MDLPISWRDVDIAASHLEGVAHRTPVATSRTANQRTGAQVFFKCENLQRMGAFKFRGAYNAMVQLDPAQREAGVAPYSSGNHSQAIALAAQLLGLRATIVMPRDAPASKVAATAGYGARIVHYDRFTEDRVAIADQIAAERGCVVVPSYDDAHIIAGQGTVGLEIVEQARELGVELDKVLSPVGGGGLIAGVSTAVKALSPATEVWGAEPAGFDETRRSLISGQRETIDPDARSICDALLTPIPGELTWPINSRNLSGIVAVTDTEVAEAMRYAFSVLKLVIEPGGAVGLAAVLSGRVTLEPGLLVILSGGNVDLAAYAKAIAA
jgi:threonine dehydratase